MKIAYDDDHRARRAAREVGELIVTSVDALAESHQVVWLQASRMRRALATVIDFGVFYALWGVAGIYVATYPLYPALGLFLLADIILTAFWGLSVGRLMTGIRIVRKDGRRPGLARALLRIALVLVSGWLGLFVFLFISPDRMWWDAAAGTATARAVTAEPVLAVTRATQTPLEPVASQLMRTFHYDATDLEMNRQGRLSSHQVARLLMRELRLWVLIAICASVAVGLGWLLLTAGWRGQIIKVAIFLVVAACVGIYLIVKAVRMLLDIIGGKVVSARGRMTMITKVSDWDWLWPWDNPKWMVCKYHFNLRSHPTDTELHAAGKLQATGISKEVLAGLYSVDFGVPKKASAKLPKELDCTVYFTPRVKRLVGIAE